MNKNYINPYFAFVFGIIIVGITLIGNYYSKTIETEAKIQYNKIFSEIKEKKEQEVNSEIKTIFNNVGKSANLVYSLSLFHIQPSKILNEVEKAIYIGKTPEGYYKIVTNENINFSNYNEISLGLITEDIENFAILIKKFKKIYTDTFYFKGMEDFGIEREKDENGEFTGKVFYTTNLNLKYLKDDFKTNSIEGENEIEIVNKYQNNQLAFESFKTMLNELSEKRKKDGKKELYFLENTTDNGIYLGTDIEYQDSNVYYITPENNLSDIFNLNGIGNKELYDTIKAENVKLILVSKKDGTDYSLCTKVEKTDDELTPEELQEKEIRKSNFTKVLKDGKTDKALDTFCELL